MIGTQPLSTSIRFLFVICTSLPNLFVQIVRRKGYFSEPSMPFPQPLLPGFKPTAHDSFTQKRYRCQPPCSEFPPIYTSLSHSPYDRNSVLFPCISATFAKRLRPSVTQERKTIAISTPSILIENLNWVHSSVPRYSHIPEQPPPKSNLTPHQQ